MNLRSDLYSKLIRAKLSFFLATISLYNAYPHYRTMKKARTKRLKKKRERHRLLWTASHFFFLFRENEGKVEARAILERARTLGMVEAVKGQRGDRYTRAQMMEGSDECILSHEKPGIRNIHLGREIRRYVSPFFIVVFVESRCERAFRIYKAVESMMVERERKREKRIFITINSTGASQQIYVFPYATKLASRMAAIIIVCGNLALESSKIRNNVDICK